MTTEKAPHRLTSAGAVEAFQGGDMDKSTTGHAPVTYVIPAYRIEGLKGAADERDFGVSDERRRADIRHGYLLALEDVTRG